MADQLFSSFTIEQLKAELSEDIFKRIAPLIQSVNQPTPSTEFLSRKQTAKLLGVSLVTIGDWTKTGKIKGYRIASRIRYKRAEIETALIQIKTRR